MTVNTIRVGAIYVIDARENFIHKPMVAINFTPKGSVDLSALNRLPPGFATSAIEIGIRVVEG